MDTVIAVLIIVAAVVFVARMIRLRMRDRKCGGCGCAGCDACNGSARRPSDDGRGDRHGGDDACD